MTASRIYGDVIAHSFGIAAPVLRPRRLLSSRVAVSRLAVGRSQFGLSPRIPPEDTFILAHYLTDVPHHELLSRGRPIIARGYEAGSLRIVNLRDEFSARITHPHQALSYYIPRAALDEAAELAGTRPVRTLAAEPGTLDPVIGHLSAALLPSLARPGEAAALFVDHVVAALVDHLLRRYGGAPDLSHLLKGGLTPYQLGRAKEALESDFGHDLSLEEVAAQCGLSRGHFAKAFRISTGTTPHRWRQGRRIDQAKRMLAGDGHTIAEIALACGFADQSHFTRVFGRMTGETPAGWRRRRGC